ncbi:MAG TPA: hypothetical protein VMA36_08860 [Candidatus Limnocylindria bacterium]|nr:hypothetical protein [Candidatus Limnocylindria bacterium]
MNLRRLAAAALAVLVAGAVVISPAPARADWTPIQYQFCNESYTQDQLEYVTEPVLSVYSVTFGQGGFFEIAPSTNWLTNTAQWSIDPRGFATASIGFTAAGAYLVFFQFTPFIWDVRYVNVTEPKVESGVFFPDGVYPNVYLRVKTESGTPVNDGTEVSFPGWSTDIDPFEAVTQNGAVPLACVAKMRQVLPSPYKLPNLLNVFIDSSQGSYCGYLSWPSDPSSSVTLDVTVKPNGCTDMPTSQGALLNASPATRFPPGPR